MAHVRTHGGSAAGLPYAEAERGLPDRTEFAVCSPPSHVSVCNLTALRGKQRKNIPCATEVGPFGFKVNALNVERERHS